MIWLPGVLSQGGKKFTWARYSLVYVLQRENLGVKSYAQDDSAMNCYNGYSINQSNGLITLNEKHNWGGGVSVGDVLYNIKEELEYDYGSVSNLEYAYEHVVLTRGISGTYPAYTYQCYKITTTLDKEFLDTVESSDPNAYPVEGRQGDYWYVRYADTPITWERYAMTEGEVQGESVTQTATSSTYFYRATSYSRSGKTFTATGTRTRASSLAVGNYLIQNNGAFVNSTSLSGDTLFKITKKSGSSTVSLTFDTYTVGDVKGSYIDSVTSYNPYEFPDDGAQDGYWYVKVAGSTGGGGSGDGTITFSIRNYDGSGNTFTATCPAGTTWSEFIASDANTVGLTIGELGSTEYACSPNGSMIYFSDSYTDRVKASDVIDPTLDYRVN